MKHVMYNGLLDELGVSEGNVSELRQGKVYEVSSEEEYPYYTLYSLVGVRGTFNSVLFTPVKPHHVAYGQEKPIIGERYSCLVLCRNGVKGWSTSPVLSVAEEGGTLLVETLNSVYHIELI